MFEKILYPTDFSDVAAKALTYIKLLKDSGAREVVVLHVVDERGIESIRRYFDQKDFEALKKNRKEEIDKLLEEIAKELTQVGLKVKLRLETGIPVREILRVEAEEGAGGWWRSSASETESPVVRAASPSNVASPDTCRS